MMVNDKTVTIQSNLIRLLLSEIRKGDYAHPGDEEAIDIILEQIYGIQPNIKSATVLDVGCGLGGTLQYLNDKGFTKLYGIDINKESISYAKNKYPDIQFAAVDALQLNAIFPVETFNLIILFNSIYAIHDKDRLLSELAKIAKPGALLVIFDYSLLNEQEKLIMQDFAGKEIMPIRLQQFLQDAKNNNWQVIQANDLSIQFITWYEQFLLKLQDEKHRLLTKYSKNNLKAVHDTFSYFLIQLKNKIMGGIVIYAQKISDI